MRKNRRIKRSESNRNSRIVTQPRPETLFARSTYTANRDPGSMVALVNTESNNATQLVLSRNGATLQLSGHEARTLLQLLEKHYLG